jgi:hypothetical protein
VKILPVIIFTLLTISQGRGDDSEENGGDYIWTVLIPKNDSRPEDVQEQDRFDSSALVRSMDRNVECFHHRLRRREVEISDLPGSFSCFCELRFDAVHPLVLDDDEKRIIKNYFKPRKRS